jgi:pimeloyl-ACP methyl ester carboxylesterase
MHILLGVVLARSPGRPQRHWQAAFLKNPADQRHATYVIEERYRNPVLLFLHGGTAMPEYFLARKYPTGLEQDFTVCWWDRRGAGLSYSANLPPETMTLEQSIADTIEVTNYLRKRFHKDKIYLMAHSGGSLIGIQAAARAWAIPPTLWVQMSYQLKSEILFGILVAGV